MEDDLVILFFNFLQIPFWLGWNLYLLNANQISLNQKLKFYYIVGAFTGTFFGMLTAIVALESLSQKILDYSQLIIPIILPLFFVVLAIYQIYKLYGNYFKMKNE